MGNRIKKYMETKTFNRVDKDRNIFSVQGSIDYCTSNRVFNDLDKVKDTAEIFIDLSEVEFLNTCIMDIVEKAKLRFKNSKIYLVNPSPFILEVLTLMGVNKLTSVILHNTSDFTSK